MFDRVLNTEWTKTAGQKFCCVTFKVACRSDLEKKFFRNTEKFGYSFIKNDIIYIIVYLPFI